MVKPRQKAPAAFAYAGRRAVRICWVRYSDSTDRPAPITNGSLRFTIHREPPKSGMMTAEIWFMVKPTAVLWA